MTILTVRWHRSRQFSSCFSWSNITGYGNGADWFMALIDETKATFLMENVFMKNKLLLYIALFSVAVQSLSTWTGSNKLTLELEFF